MKWFPIIQASFDRIIQRLRIILIHSDCNHRWAEGSYVRKCAVCGDMLFAHSNLSTQSYDWLPWPETCERCLGARIILDPRSLFVECPECKGTGYAGIYPVELIKEWTLKNQKLANAEILEES